MTENRRDRPTGKRKEQQALLDELDSLKALLNKDKERENKTPDTAPWEFIPPAGLGGKTAAKPEIPSLDDAVDVKPPGQSRLGRRTPAATEIPLLDEVVAAPGKRLGETGVPELTDIVDSSGQPLSTPPSGEALRNLVELLVERRLQKLKPLITSQVMSELERLYPSLKKR